MRTGQKRKVVQYWYTFCIDWKFDYSLRSLPFSNDTQIGMTQPIKLRSRVLKYTYVVKDISAKPTSARK